METETDGTPAESERRAAGGRRAKGQRRTFRLLGLRQTLNEGVGPLAYLSSGAVCTSETTFVPKTVMVPENLKCFSSVDV